MKAVELFSGAGGFGLGLKYAGVKVVAAFEYNEDAAKTYALNLDDVVTVADVRDVDFRPYKGVDLVVGGPPCQPFSCASVVSKGKEDPRDMIPQFIRAVAEIRPKIFLMENVPSLAAPRHRAYLQSILSQFAELGYNVDYAVLKASDFGLPTKRRRIFVAGRLDGKPKFPLSPGTAPATISCRKLLDLTDLTECSTNIIYAKNPVVHRSVGGSLLVNGRGKVLDPDAPANTVLANASSGRHIVDPNGVFAEYHAHLQAGGKPRTGKVFGCRRINLLEAKRIQTFPDGFTTLGSNNSQWKQIGNAVPPRFAAAVIHTLIQPTKGN